MAVRLNSTDQHYLGLILAANLADGVSDALRCGLRCAGEKARRLIAKRGDA